MSDLHPLSGAYAVDALDDLERARFEKHLQECPDCAAEVSSLREAAALLALSVDAGPSPELRSRVLAEISTVRPLPPTAPAQEVVRRTARRFPQLVAAAVAAVLLATGVGVTAWHPWNRSRPGEQPVAAQVMDAPDSRRQTLEVPGGGSATVVHSRALGKAVLITRDMPKAPAHKVYELWLQDADGVMKPAGLMTGGLSRQTVVLRGNAVDATGVGITVEPAGGSQAPTTQPVALFDFRKSV
jgi:anti-sigma-K factor RskA